MWFGGAEIKTGFNIWMSSETYHIDPDYKFNCADYPYLAQLLVVQEHHRPEVYLGSWERLKLFPEPINEPIINAMLWNMMEANHAIHLAKQNLETANRALCRESGGQLEFTEARNKR